MRTTDTQPRRLPGRAAVVGRRILRHARPGFFEHPAVRWPAAGTEAERSRRHALDIADRRHRANYATRMN